MTAAQIIDANLPVLEIIGSRINSFSFESARMRHSQLKNQASQTYSQRLIYGGNRDFQGMESVLSKQVHSWLYRQLISDVQR